MDKINTSAAPLPTSAATPPGSPRPESGRHQSGVWKQGKVTQEIHQAAIVPQKGHDDAAGPTPQALGSREVSQTARAISSLLDPSLGLNREAIHEGLFRSITNENHSLVATTLNDLHDLANKGEKDAQQNALKAIFDYLASGDYEVDRDALHKSLAELLVRHPINDKFQADLKAAASDEDYKTVLRIARQAAREASGGAAAKPNTSAQAATPPTSPAAVAPKTPTSLPEQPAWAQGIRDAVQANDYTTLSEHGDRMVEAFAQNKELAQSVETLMLDLLELAKVEKTSKLWPSISKDILPRASLMAMRHGQYDTATRLLDANKDIRENSLKTMLALDYDQVGLTREQRCQDLAGFILQEYKGPYNWGKALEACDAPDRVDLAKALAKQLEDKVSFGAEDPSGKVARDRGNLITRVLHKLLDWVRGGLKPKANLAGQAEPLDPKAAALQKVLDEALGQVSQIAQNGSLDQEASLPPLNPAERVSLLAGVAQALESQDSVLAQASPKDKADITSLVYKHLGDSIQAYAAEAEAP